MALAKSDLSALEFDRILDLIASEAGHEMYHHGICTLMMAEAVGMTQGPLAAELKKGVEKAVAIILQAQRNRPAKFGPLVAEPLADAPITTGLDPEHVGRQVRQAILDNDAWIFTPPEAFDLAIERFQRLTEAMEAAKRA